MLTGVIVRAYNSYYYVRNGDVTVACKIRGRFKKDRYSLMVGDQVHYQQDSQNEGTIENILPRHSLLKRPAVANVDQVVLVFAAVNPNISTTLVDKLLVLAESSHLEIVLVINKSDLAEPSDLAGVSDIYGSIGYPMIFASAHTGRGVHELQEKLKGKITAFAGPSGAGKSSLLNSIEPGLTLVIGEVSAKIGRGKHTTRYAQLLPLSTGGFVVDTPGFSATEFTDIAMTDLAWYFPEFARLARECKFSTCLHDREPQCAVKEALQKGIIPPSRYQSYQAILQEMRDLKKG